MFILQEHAFSHEYDVGEGSRAARRLHLRSPQLWPYGGRTVAARWPHGGRTVAVRWPYGNCYNFCVHEQIETFKGNYSIFTRFYSRTQKL